MAKLGIWLLEKKMIWFVWSSQPYWLQHETQKVVLYVMCISIGCWDIKINGHHFN